MNPCDALTKDYGMYYDGCYMKHSTHGVGRIHVIGGDLYLQTSPRSDPKLVKPSYLECWWPRPGAFNHNNRAVYISRRAIRNMRKSAVGGDHYSVKWGSPYSIDIMMVLKEGPNSLSIDRAMQKMDSKEMTSVAVSRDIILYPDEEPDNYVVVFRGMEVGTLYKGGGFTPTFSNNPLTPRVMRQLEGLT